MRREICLEKAAKVLHAAGVDEGWFEGNFPQSGTFEHLQLINIVSKVVKTYEQQDNIESFSELEKLLSRKKPMPWYKRFF